MIDLGILHKFLGLQVLALLDSLFISQYKYVMDLLKLFNMDDYKACVTPYKLGVKLKKYCGSPQVDATLYHQLVRSFIYLTHSQPYISFALSVVSCFM